MNESAEELLLRAQESLSESNDDGALPDPDTGQDSDNAAPAAEITIDEETYTGEIITGTLEDPGMTETQKQDISFNVALLFVASMAVGLMIFSILSRKWHA